MRAVLCVLLLSACGDDSGGPDMSMPPDIAAPLDLIGVDLYGVLNCKGINDCVLGKLPGQTGPCQNAMCVAACGQRGTSTSYSLYIMLQSCFDQNCPKVSDMASPICQGALTGNPSNACLTCIHNTQQPDTTSCNPSGAPECRMCYAAAQACLMDM